MMWPVGVLTTHLWLHLGAGTGRFEATFSCGELTNNSQEFFKNLLGSPVEHQHQHTVDGEVAAMALLEKCKFIRNPNKCIQNNLDTCLLYSTRFAIRRQADLYQVFNHYRLGSWFLFWIEHTSNTTNSYTCMYR